MAVHQVDGGATYQQDVLQLRQPVGVLDGAQEAALVGVGGGREGAGDAGAHQLLEARLHLAYLVVVDRDEVALRHRLHLYALVTRARTTHDPEPHLATHTSHGPTLHATATV